MKTTELLEATVNQGCNNLREAKFIALAAEAVIALNIKGLNVRTAHKMALDILSSTMPEHMTVTNSNDVDSPDGVVAYEIGAAILETARGEVNLSITVKEDGMMVTQLEFYEHQSNWPVVLFTSYTSYTVAESVENLAAMIKESKRAARSYYAKKGKERKEKKEQRGYTEQKQLSDNTISLLLGGNKGK